VSFLFSLLTNLPGFLNGLVGYLAKRQDSSKEVALSVLLAEQARVNAMKDVTLSAMSHPIWWVAWGIGVFPVLFYHACIFFVSLFPWMGWTILKVPPDQIEFAHVVVNWMFGIGGASALVTGVAQWWRTRM